jgi:uncharacterized protein
MANIEKHEAGSFCWMDLATTDQAAAKKFYGGLFGWAAKDSPMGENQFYTMFSLDGREVGAGYTLAEHQRAMGMGTHWMPYVATESADASVKRAEELGAKIIAPAFDVFDAGRMAMFEDPTGAKLALWEAKTHVGTRITGVPGTLMAADLITHDQDKAGEFYEKLFGWQVGKEDEEPEHRYYHLFHHGEFIGGIPPASYAPKGVPPHWQIYLRVANSKASEAKVKELGGRIYMPTMKVEDVGWMSVVADPQGATFAMFQMAGKTVVSGQ